MICKTWKRFVQFVGQMYHLSCITIICQTNRGANCEGKVVDLLKGNHLTSETRGEANPESRSRSSEAFNFFFSLGPQNVRKDQGPLETVALVSRSISSGKTLFHVN